MCNTEINECLPNPCNILHSTCQDKIGTFSCECDPGYTGTTCTEKIDECSSSPCENGVCVDKTNKYTCDCFPGWTGENCDLDVNECETGTFTCLNSIGGLDNTGCVNEPGGYSCNCKTGFSGKFCNNVESFCDSDPCKNDAICHMFGSSKFYCICLPGFTGKSCEVEMDPCEGLYSALTKSARLRNLFIFEVFGVKFSAKTSIFQNHPIKRARQASRKGNF